VAFAADRPALSAVVAAITRAPAPSVAWGVATLLPPARRAASTGAPARLRVRLAVGAPSAEEARRLQTVLTQAALSAAFAAAGLARAAPAVVLAPASVSPDVGRSSSETGASATARPAAHMTPAPLAAPALPVAPAADRRLPGPRPLCASPRAGADSEKCVSSDSAVTGLAGARRGAAGGDGGGLSLDVAQLILALVLPPPQAPSAPRPAPCEPSERPVRDGRLRAPHRSARRPCPGPLPRQLLTLLAPPPRRLVLSSALLASQPRASSSGQPSQPPGIKPAPLSLPP